MACKQKNFEAYSAVFAPEFRFLFTPLEESGNASCRSGTWTLDDELGAMKRLLTRAEQLEFTISLPHGEAEPASEKGMEGTQRIRVTDHYVQVTAPPETWVSRDDLHEFYFRPGREEEQEDPGDWFLVEWREIPSPTKPRPPDTSPTPVHPTHWSWIKCAFAGETTGSGSAAPVGSR